MAHAAQRGRGARHRFKAHAWDKGTAYKMPDGVLYISELWRKFTLDYLETYPACARCKREGRTVAAKVARHIRGRHAGRNDFDQANIQALCFRCIGITAPMPGKADDPAA